MTMSIRAGFQKNAMIAVVAVAGGYLGSVLHEWISANSGVLRAQRFEVVGSSGSVLSYWGPDSNPHIPAATPKGALLVFMDTEGVRRFQLGSRVGDYAPELQMYGKDGPRAEAQQSVPEPRLLITLGYDDDPFSGMRDHQRLRVLLGAEHGDAPSIEEDDWGITFKSRTNAQSYLGTHGVNPEKSQAFVTVRDDQGNVWTAPPSFHFELAEPR
jgi:hypothetical protein